MQIANRIKKAPGQACLLAAGLYLALSTTSGAAELPAMPEPLENVVLQDKPADEQWLWVGDFQQGHYGRAMLFNAGSGELLGMLGTGWEGIKLDIPRGGNVIYNHAMYMSRGYRGDRTDAITTYDARTLQPLAELIVPAKAVRGWPDPNHTALTDDDRFLLVQFTTPASSVGVADMENGHYVGEIETAGCHHVMAAGPRRFFTLCGDGSALLVELNDQGKESQRRRYPAFFDVSRDPLHGSGTRSGDRWYFVSHLGMVHTLDIGGEEPRALEPWPVYLEGGSGRWIPGATMQPVSVHDSSQRLYVAMHHSDLEIKGGGADFHRKGGTEIWVFDIATQRLLQRLPLANEATTIAISQAQERPYLYVASFWAFVMAIMDPESGEVLRELSIPGVPIQLQPVR
ncbi:amine dehydrogenase large subunit [Parahaliea mediterranea]|uniref:Amine dehydrogenase n=1 Tax=Parahaliea mediterranea TaxID=651086 RepID=A0A939DGC0_9GAMM|nr:amine dehydrogenase large subunit [Parahaliea mediterranea]MBN7797590.1 hypothetical protein [Parahaliea mediterranea]